ncbi:MAG: ABC transporter permease [Anaerolineaceae bacterium]|nr:ABC transporter permease [Anaerolineaceae bacterium]
MMKIFELAYKDLTQVLRDKRSLVFLVAMPLVFTLFMGFAYRSGEDSAEEDPRMALAWVEESPASTTSMMLYERLADSDTLKPERMPKAAALEALHKQDVAGVLVIPAGFGDPVEAGSQQLTLVADTTSTVGQSLYQLLRVPVSQLMSAVEIGQISAETLNNSAEFTPALELAWRKWGENNAQNLVQVEQAVALKSQSWFGDNPYNQASPGMIIQFAIMGLVNSAQILVQERKNRTLQRLMTTSMRPREIIAGHMLAMFALVLLQTLVLVVFGQFLLDVNYLRVPFGTLLLVMALGAWVASMGLLVGVIAKSDDQVVLYSMLAMFLFSALGGTWFPLEASGGVFAALGKLLPSAWAMTGLQNILIRGLGLESLWQPVLVLLVYALGFFMLAVWRFRRAEM